MSRVLARKWVQWVLLIMTTGVLVAGFKWAHAPAPMLLGPLLAGMGFGGAGAIVRPPPWLRMAGSTLIGCLVAVALGATMGPQMWGRIVTFLMVGLSTLCLCFALGWVLCRAGWFEGTTAIWSLTPGGAASMITLAQESGADARLVGLMQYFRVLLVASSAIALAHLAQTATSDALHDSSLAARWLPPLDPVGLAGAFTLCVVGGGLSKVLRFPAGVFLLPGLAGAALLATGRFHLQVPPILAACAYATVGWTIGLSFTRPTLLHSARALPRIVAATVALIALCAAAGGVVSVVCKVDPLTGYLATSPGGVDSILIIAASTPVDLPFILAAQICRIILVLLIGPPATQWLARHAKGSGR